MKEYIPGQDITVYQNLLHGDVSGIQDFIFNIKSEGAAKTLKSRSFFVRSIADLCVELVEDVLGADNCLLFYNGGGGFYIFCKTLNDADFQNLRKEVQRELEDMEVYLSLSRTKLGDFPETWRTIHRQANEDKLQKFENFESAFLPQTRYKGDDRSWRKFAKNLSKCQRFESIGSPGREKLTEDTITLFRNHLRLTGQRNPQNQPGDINWHLPLWHQKLMDAHEKWVKYLDERDRKQAILENDPNAAKPTEPGEIIDFETLGHFAKNRTGTDKIAVLKMDVDFLGDLFSKEARDWGNTKRLSDALKTFFENEVLKLWQRSFHFKNQNGDAEETPFFENIYVVFAGGDDCMMIGGWDAVFEFSGLVRRAFDDFFEDKIAGFGLDKLPTLSASLTMVDCKFPVVRMGILSEEAIKTAKKDGDGSKNRVSVFGKVLTWREFLDAGDIANQLEILIKKEGESRGILQRIRNSHRGFEPLIRRAIEEQKISNPAVWRLAYYIRKSKNKAGLDEIVEKYQRAILRAITNRERTNSDQFPVAARWAEFKTR